MAAEAYRHFRRLARRFFGMARTAIDLRGHVFVDEKPVPAAERGSGLSERMTGEPKPKGQRQRSKG